MPESPWSEPVDRLWFVRVVSARDADAAPDRDRPVTPKTVLGVKISVHGDEIVARFTVTAPDAERASMRALSRWRRTAELVGLAGFGVASLVVERSEPDSIGPFTIADADHEGAWRPRSERLRIDLRNGEAPADDHPHLPYRIHPPGSDATD